MKRCKALNGEELLDMLSQLRDAANRHLGLTNYIHIDDLNLADDGTFTVVMKKSLDGEPKSISSRVLLEQREDIKRIDFWEEHIFWSWDNRYMTLRDCAICVTEYDTQEIVGFTVNDELEDMKEWQGSYIPELSNRDSIVEQQNTDTGSDSVVDSIFSKNKSGEYEVKSKGDGPKPNSQDMTESTGDEVSLYLTEIYNIWFNMDTRPMRNYFRNPRDEKAYDVKQTTEIDRIEDHARRMTRYLDELYESSGGSFDSSIIANNSDKLQYLYSAYTGLDNEIRPNRRSDEFQDAWTRFSQRFRSLFSRMEEI